jgi:hypothetical protein
MGPAGIDTAPALRSQGRESKKRAAVELQRSAEPALAARTRGACPLIARTRSWCERPTSGAGVSATTTAVTSGTGRAYQMSAAVAHGGILPPSSSVRRTGSCSKDCQASTRRSTVAAHETLLSAAWIASSGASVRSRRRHVLWLRLAR